MAFDLFQIFKKTKIAKSLKGSMLVKSTDYMNLTSSASWGGDSSMSMLKDGYEGNTWAYACIDMRQKSAASVPIKIRKVKKDGSKEDVDHEIMNIFKAPFPGMSYSELIKSIVGQLDIQGAYYGKVTLGGSGGNIPLQVVQYPIGSVSPIVSGGVVTRYKITTEKGKTSTVSASKVLAIKYAHPSDPYIGMPPLKAAGKAVDIDNEASDFQKVSMQNRGITDGVFNMSGDITVDEWEEAKRQVEDQYRNNGTNAREPWVIANAAFTPMSQTMADLDFQGGRVMTRTEICAAFHVPPMLVGIYDNSALSNVKAAKAIYWEDGIEPLLKDIESQLNEYMRDILDRDGLEIYFDLSNVSALRSSTKEKMDTAKTMKDMGVPLQEINRVLDLNLSDNALPSDNSVFMPAGLVQTHYSEQDNSGITDREFDRIMSIVQQVASGSLTIEAGRAMLKLVLVDASDADIGAYLQPAESGEKSLSVDVSAKTAGYE